MKLNWIRVLKLIKKWLKLNRTEQNNQLQKNLEKDKGNRTMGGWKTWKWKTQRIERRLELATWRKHKEFGRHQDLKELPRSLRSSCWRSTRSWSNEVKVKLCGSRSLWLFDVIMWIYGKVWWTTIGCIFTKVHTSGKYALRCKDIVIQMQLIIYKLQQSQDTSFSYYLMQTLHLITAII